jgi:hypothetical protein
MLERSGFRARGARPFSNLPQNGGCRIAGHDGDGNDAPASGFHFFAAHDLVTGPIATLYENVGEQARYDFARRQVIEDHDGVHALKSREDFRTFAFRDDGTAFALQLPHTGVTVEADDECVSQLARQLQAANVAGMQQVKTAVREDDAAAVAFLAAKLQNRFLQREDRRFQRVSMQARTRIKMLPMKKLVYHAREAPRLQGRGSR